MVIMSFYRNVVSSLSGLDKISRVEQDSFHYEVPMNEPRSSIELHRMTEESMDKIRRLAKSGLNTSYHLNS